MPRLVQEARQSAAATEAATDSVTPKAIATLSISAPALAVAPEREDRTIGFAAATEPWTGNGAFAPADEPVLPPGMVLARFDEVNEIDLAADAEAQAVEPAGRSDALSGMSLVTQANAAPVQRVNAKARETSWLSWAYAKLADGALTAALAIRSLFV